MDEANAADLLQNLDEQVTPFVELQSLSAIDAVLSASNESFQMECKPGFVQYPSLRGPESKAQASEGRVVPGSRSAGRFFD